MVGIVDLLGLLGAWDTGCSTYDIADGDPTGPDGVVGINDFLQLLAVGPVPLKNVVRRCALPH